MNGRYLRAVMLGTLFLLATAMLPPGEAGAHCDTLEGPVVQSARTALETGDVTPVLKWVRQDDEHQMRTAFNRTLAVRGKGEDVRELADMYFFETLVRVHREGEGAPYTGLKSADTVDPAVVLADRALESGNVDHLAAVLTGALEKGIRERFQQALQSSRHADDSVDAGRKFVHRYVLFTHYVEGLHNLIQGGAGHHGSGEEKAEGHGH
ncbi:MAG TPA: hypothetical protein ENN06_01830 [Desulfobacteraceae bacterium]|nr:hypothetical protein [Desulfobacteraceae bacterium]